MADEAIGFSSLFATRPVGQKVRSVEAFVTGQGVVNPLRSCFLWTPSHIAKLLVWTSQFEGNKPCQKCRRIKLTNYAFDVA